MFGILFRAPDKDYNELFGRNDSRANAN